MAASLPYLSSPGTIDSLLKKIKEAATPARFTTDFVTTVLQFKGGTGASMPPLLKKIGLLNTDGTPTPLYDRLRNDASTGTALADAVRIGFKPLYKVNEYAHKLTDTDLKGLIVQVTGLEKDNRVVELTFGTLKRLIKHADFSGQSTPAPGPVPTEAKAVAQDPAFNPEALTVARSIGLSYTINLNLPATTNIEVFNAIFKSLRENLLNG